MELEATSGVRVFISTGENGKILAFDRRVATVEFTQEEAVRLARSLVREKQAKLGQAIRQLIDNGYFEEPKSFADIRDRLQSIGLKIKSASLHVVVTNMVERGLLMRKGSPRSYVYVMEVKQKVT